jgi:hypothetical protein
MAPREGLLSDLGLLAYNAAVGGARAAAVDPGARRGRSPPPLLHVAAAGRRAR